MMLPKNAGRRRIVLKPLDGLDALTLRRVAVSAYYAVTVPLKCLRTYSSGSV